MQGLGKQALAALYTLAGHWGVGMTIAYATAITAGLGITGLWIDLLAAVSTTGGRWCNQSSQLDLWSGITEHLRSISRTRTATKWSVAVIDRQM
jgi:hypothetical protein